MNASGKFQQLHELAGFQAASLAACCFKHRNPWRHIVERDPELDVFSPRPPSSSRRIASCSRLGRTDRGRWRFLPKANFDGVGQAVILRRSRPCRNADVPGGPRGTMSRIPRASEVQSWRQRYGDIEPDGLNTELDDA